MAKKINKNEAEKKIDEKIIKAFLLAHKDFKDAETQKDLAASELILEMKKAKIEKLTFKDKNVTFSKRDTLQYNEYIEALGTALKKQQEVARAKKDFVVTKTSEFLRVTDNKEKK